MYKLSFFPSTLYFSSFTKAKAKVYKISSSSSSLSLSEVMSISSPLISAKIDFKSSTESFSTEYETWAHGSVLNFLASSVEINLFQLSPPTVS